MIHGVEDDTENREREDDRRSTVQEVVKSNVQAYLTTRRTEIRR